MGVPELETSVFLIPLDIVKSKEDRLVVLNGVAKSVVEAHRGKHKTHVFTYRGKPVTRIFNSGWKLARKKAAARYAQDHHEPASWGFANLRVHD